MRDSFGSEIPIPESTKGRHVKYQEAARLYIHNRWSIQKIADVLLSDIDNLKALDRLHTVKRKDNWDEFMATIHAALKPSLWTQKEFEVTDQKAIREEHKRRMEAIPMLRDQEQKIMDSIDDTEPTSKLYISLLNALRRVRDLIDQATGVSEHRKEQSMARQSINKKNIDREFLNQQERARAALPAPKNPGDDAKSAKVSIFNI